MYACCLSGGSQWLKGCKTSCSQRIPGTAHQLQRHSIRFMLSPLYLAGIAEHLQYTAQHLGQCLELTEWAACGWHSQIPDVIFQHVAISLIIVVVIWKVRDGVVRGRAMQLYVCAQNALILGNSSNTYILVSPKSWPYFIITSITV